MSIFSRRVTRFVICTALPALIILATFLVIRTDRLPPEVNDKFPHQITGEPKGYNPEIKAKPLYKPAPAESPPILDPFPLAVEAKSGHDIPLIPSWNVPPATPPSPPTPLLISFTRNWPLLQQTLVSYLTAGWPATSIFIVENTGVMHSNALGHLSLQNPFYLPHHTLKDVLGVTVLVTPTLLTFAQLQNYFLFTAVERNWTHYWWAHMDTTIISPEDYRDSSNNTYKSAYTRAIDSLEKTKGEKWGMVWYHYDHLALVNTEAYLDVGGWDTQIPFYKTDCDMHERLFMKGYKAIDVDVGMIWDVGSTVGDLRIFYERDDEMNGEAYKKLLTELDTLQHRKIADHEHNTANMGRNAWQAAQKGGKGEPFYRDPEGFGEAVKMWQGYGMDVFHAKWGYPECGLRDIGLVEEDMWRVEKDWHTEEVQRQWFRDRQRGKGG